MKKNKIQLDPKKVEQCFNAGIWEAQEKEIQKKYNEAGEEADFMLLSEEINKFSIKRNLERCLVSLYLHVSESA